MTTFKQKIKYYNNNKKVEKNEIKRKLNFDGSLIDKFNKKKINFYKVRKFQLSKHFEREREIYY